MEKEITTFVNYIPTHVMEDSCIHKRETRTKDFKLTGKWAIEKHHHPESKIAGEYTVAEHFSYKMFIEVQIETKHWKKNPEFRDLTWYEARVLGMKRQDENIEVVYTDTYWIGEDDFIINERYLPERVEFDCNNVVIENNEQLSGENV